MVVNIVQNIGAKMGIFMMIPLMFVVVTELVLFPWVLVFALLHTEEKDVEFLSVQMVFSGMIPIPAISTVTVLLLEVNATVH